MQTASASSERPERLWEGKQELVQQALSAAMGFLFSGASIYGSASPFGVAWAGAAQPDKALASSLGALIGYLFSMGSSSGTMRYLAAIILLMGLRWSLSIFSERTVRMFSPLMAGLSILVTGLAAVLAGGATLYGVIMTISEVVLTVTGGYLFVKTVQGIANGQAFASGTVIATAVTCGILMISLTRISVGGVSLGHILAIDLVLCCGCFAGQGAGAIAGIAAGLSATLAGDGYLLAGFAAGGLAAGVFSPTGRIGSAAAFAVANAICLVTGSPSQPVIPPLIEVTVASGVFMLLPTGALTRMGLLRPADTADGDMLRKVITSRLRRTKNALSEIAELTGQVNRKLERLGGDDFDSVLHQTVDSVCRKCPESASCWQLKYNDTMAAFNAAAAAVRAGADATASDLPPHFAASCKRVEPMLSAVNAQMHRYMGRQGLRREMSQMRMVVTDQFDGMAMVLDAVEKELDELSAARPDLDRLIGDYFDRAEAEPVSVTSFTDRYGRITVIVEVPKRKLGRIDRAMSAVDLSEFAQQEFDAPEVIEDENTAQLWYTGRAQYFAEFGISQRSAGEAKLCGDSGEHFTDRGGRACMLLSDGMGVGTSAALDATMTTSLLSRLVRAGVGFDAALRLVNSALIAKAGEERLATVDAACLDLYTCHLELYKAGAAPTFNIRSGRVMEVESASLPAGILQGVAFEKTDLGLDAGDIVVMVSDGVVETGTDWVPSQLLALKDKPLDDLCRGLLDTARDRRIDGREDDMTVMAAAVRKAS